MDRNMSGLPYYKHLLGLLLCQTPAVVSKGQGPGHGALRGLLWISAGHIGSKRFPRKGVLPQTSWNNCLVKNLNKKSTSVWGSTGTYPSDVSVEAWNEAALVFGQSLMIATISQLHKHLLYSLLGLTKVIAFGSGNFLISLTNLTHFTTVF